MNPEFLVRFLQTKTARRYFKRHATSTAGNYNINTESIKGIPVPIIDLDDQSSIVLQLQKMEQNLNNLKDNIETGRKLRKSLINQIL